MAWAIMLKYFSSSIIQRKKKAEATNNKNKGEKLKKNKFFQGLKMAHFKALHFKIFK